MCRLLIGKHIETPLGYGDHVIYDERALVCMRQPIVDGFAADVACGSVGCDARPVPVSLCCVAACAHVATSTVKLAPTARASAAVTGMVTVAVVLFLGVPNVNPVVGATCTV